MQNAHVLNVRHFDKARFPSLSERGQIGAACATVEPSCSHSPQSLKTQVPEASGYSLPAKISRRRQLYRPCLSRPKDAFCLHEGNYHLTKLDKMESSHLVRAKRREADHVLRDSETSLGPVLLSFNLPKMPLLFGAQKPELQTARQSCWRGQLTVQICSINPEDVPLERPENKPVSQLALNEAVPVGINSIPPRILDQAVG